MATAKLIYTSSKGLRSAPLPPAQRAVIGSGAGATVMLADPTVSEQHCAVGAEAGQWFAEDLGSAAGTLLNGERIHRRALRHGDILRCGAIEVQFVEAPPPQDPSAELRRLQEQAREQGLEREALRRDLSRCAAERDDLRVKLATTRQDAERLTQHLERAERALVAVEADARRLEGEVRQLRAGAASGQRERQVLQQDVEAKAQELAALRSLLAESERRRLQGESTLRDMDGRQQQGEQKIATLLADVERAQVAAEQLRTALRKREEDLTLLTVHDQARQKEMDSLRELVQMAQRAIQERKVALIEAERMLRRESDRLKSATQQLGVVTEERDALLSRIHADLAPGAAAPIDATDPAEAVLALCRHADGALLEMELEIAAQEESDARRLKAHVAELLILFRDTMKSILASLTPG